jgi:diaminopimelate epimerase
MNLKFYKYQGTGNDFVMIDNRDLSFPNQNIKLIANLCDRKFGIGADGLILLQNHSNSDFEMVYFNADGSTSTMCGNGGRCIVAFAKFLKIIENETTFMASDGLHFAKIDQNNIALQMIDVENVAVHKNYTYLYTGSPHHIILSDNISKINVKEEGAKIRFSNLYGNAGCNINFVEKFNENSFNLRTYERGVEDETLSCGTGATAAAIAMFHNGLASQKSININVLGGKLKIEFQVENKIYTNVFLKGEALHVFSGTINI